MGCARCSHSHDQGQQGTVECMNATSTPVTNPHSVLCHWAMPKPANVHDAVLTRVTLEAVIPLSLSRTGRRHALDVVGNSLRHSEHRRCDELPLAILG